jgi:hypothetical protein
VRNFLKISLAIISTGLALPATAVDWSGSLGADVRWFDWREYINDRQLLKETGPLATGIVKGEVRQGPEGLFGSVEAGWGGGLTRYDGRLWNQTPYETDAWEEIVEAEWRVGWRSGKGSIHLGYMQRDWRRFIEGTSSAEERYRWRLVTMGGEAPLLSSPRWRVALNLGIPIESYEKVYFSKYDDLTLEPGAGFFWRLSFPFQPASERYRQLSLEPYFQQQNMKKSNSARLAVNGVPTIDSVFQPESLRRELGLVLRWQVGGD